MAKRAASKQLTQDNWDEDDDEKETAGTYKAGEPKVLETRVIKKAKRSLTHMKESQSSHTPFIQFSGFGGLAAKKPSFSFLKTNCEISSPQNAVLENHAAKQNGSKSLKIEAAEGRSASSLTSEKLNQPSSTTKDSNSCSPSWKKYESRDVDYYRQLKALNESLMPWIEMHLSKNPWCDFTPVFDDYKKHLSIIEKKYPLKAKPSSYLPKPFSFKVPSAPVQKSSNATLDEKVSSGEPAPKMKKLDPSTTQSEDVADSTEMLYGAGFKSNTTNTSTFSSGIKATTTATVPSSNSGPTSSCRSGEKDAPENEQTPSYTFSVAKTAEQSPIIAKQSGKQDLKPFTFAISPVAKPKDTDSRPSIEVNDEDEYMPPINEVTVVKEEDALYSKKCKLFYKKDGTYIEKGVGMLYLKPMGESTQLLIRADTNLGNILLNIKLHASLPMQRMGKNNVLVVCVPNPPMTPENSDSKETAPLLIRVKTGDDADELLDILSKYKS